jgi:amino acid transporter
MEYNEHESLLCEANSPDYGSSSSDDASNAIPSRATEEHVLPETATYGRNLGWSGAYILVISRVIGSGIFATPGSITKSVGSIGLSLLLWVAGAVLAACGLSISLEYGCMLPRSGGEKVYLEFTYRHPRFLASTLVAVQAVLLGFTASNCIIFGRYTIYALGYDTTEFSQKALAVGLLTVITVIHGLHVKTGIVIQNALGWIKVFLVVFMILSGFYVLAFHTGDAAQPSPGAGAFTWNVLWEESNWGWGVVSTALFKVLYSYAGLANVNNVLNEVKNPVRTLKSVGPVALITVCFFYLLVNIAYFLVIPLDEIKGSGELVAALFFERVFGNGFGKTILPLAIAISAAGNVMVVTFSLVSIFH